MTIFRAISSYYPWAISLDFFLLCNLSPTLMTKRSNYQWYFFSFVNTRDGIKPAIWFRVSSENWGDFTFKFPDPSSTIQFRFLVTLNLNKIKIMQEKYFHYIVFHISTSTKTWRAPSLTSQEAGAQHGSALPGSGVNGQEHNTMRFIFSIPSFIEERGLL